MLRQESQTGLVNTSCYMELLFLIINSDENLKQQHQELLLVMSRGEGGPV